MTLTDYILGGGFCPSMGDIVRRDYVRFPDRQVFYLFWLLIQILSITLVHTEAEISLHHFLHVHKYVKVLPNPNLT